MLNRWIYRGSGGVPAALALSLCVGMGESLCGGTSSTAARVGHNNPFTRNEKTLAAGKAVYERHCADCHGEKGQGDGKRAIDLDPPPTNLCSSDVTDLSDTALFRKITRGRKPMPGFGKSTSSDERWLVVLYLRALSEGHKQDERK